MNKEEQEAMIELADGIYFNMPEAQYHALDRLSTSGIKKLLVSPLQFYTETFDEMFVRPETKFLTAGKAYHKRILEGQKAFEDCYVQKLSKAQYPDALDKQDELKGWCKSHDLAVGGTKPVLIERILDCEPSMKDNILSLLQAAFDKEHAHQQQLEREEYIEIEKAAAILEATHLGMHFSSGFPEVSILWTDEATGVKCKARIDYLRHDLLSDLKTFSNSQRKSIPVCISQAIAYQRYNIQACFYMNGLKAIKKMLAEKKAFVDDDSSGDFLQLLIDNEQEFVFVFQESGQVNNCAARKFVPKYHGMTNNYWDMTQETIYLMMDKYSSFMKSHGKTLPWIEHQETETFDDSDFPVWMLEQ